MEPREYIDLSKRLAEIILRAYGKPPGQFDDLEEMAVGAFVYGAHRSCSVSLGVYEWQSNLAMLEILTDLFGFLAETAANALDFFAECLEKPETDPNVNIVIHCGDSGADLLSDPEELGKQLKEIVYVLGTKR